MASHSVERLRLLVEGQVQGVGFRPAVYRLAVSSGLGGWVCNSTTGALIEVEGTDARNFAGKLLNNLPSQALIERLTSLSVSPLGETDFVIASSRHQSEYRARITPDLATCQACLAELLEPTDRRYRYPFLNCTECGPRFSILKSLPYDRVHTSMREFTMCTDCQREYDTPGDRRFHAQPNACAVCGPALARPLEVALEGIASAKVAAVKGLGGFHLMADPFQPLALTRVRELKGRQAQPLAVMFPDLAQIRQHCEVNSLEEGALKSPQAPIVLLKARRGSPLQSLVAPGLNQIGAILPYTPLHHLLMKGLHRPLIVTSANGKNDPIPTRRPEIEADLVLDHNRPIVRGVDDSIVWVVADQVRVLRLGRGYAPLLLPFPPGPGLLALGGHQKSCTAVGAGGRLVLGPHLGDLDGLRALNNFEKRAGEMSRLYQVPIEVVVGDRHPDYASNRWPESNAPDVKRVEVWHHHAHLASCLLDNQQEEEIVLGVVWDGSGLGPDHTVWGGEFLLGNSRQFHRVHHWTPYPLLGGEVAVREPRRIALALSLALGQAFPLPFSERERRNLARFSGPKTSSTGRLFDGLASLLGLCQVAEFEGHAAMMLEASVEPEETEAYEGLDWPEAFSQVLEDLKNGIATGRIAARFHNWLAEVIVEIACREGCQKVALSGGCFQNRYLLERSRLGLLSRGFQVLLHRRLPPNDGGLCAGQAVVACA